MGTTRYGEYAAIRQAPPIDANPENPFDAFGYGLNPVPPPGTGTQTNTLYDLFGQPASSCQVIK